MKKSIFALVFALSACGAQPAMAKSDYSSPICEFAISSDIPIARVIVTKELGKVATPGQKEALKEISDKDVIVASTNMFCENFTAKQTLEWIGL